MVIYSVLYTGIDWSAYYSGSMNYMTTKEKLFSTRQKAENFVSSEYKENDIVIKAAGKGDICELIVD